MDLSENDTIMLGMAAVGELVILDQGVVRIIERTDAYVQHMIMGCQVFHQCPNLAVTIIVHPVIGKVPSCERCKEIVS